MHVTHASKSLRLLQFMVVSQVHYVGETLACTSAAASRMPTPTLKLELVSCFAPADQFDMAAVTEGRQQQQHEQHQYHYGDFETLPRPYGVHSCCNISLHVTNCKFSINLKSVRSFSEKLNRFLYGNKANSLPVVVDSDKTSETFVNVTLGRLKLHINRAGFINVTGCRDTTPTKTLRLLAPLLRISVRRLQKHTKIDSLSFSGVYGPRACDGCYNHLKKRQRKIPIDLHLLRAVAETDIECVRECTFYTGKFPCLYLHTRHYGCVSLFSNGKFTGLGVKSVEKLETLTILLSQLTDEYYSAT